MLPVLQPKKEDCEAWTGRTDKPLAMMWFGRCKKPVMGKAQAGKQVGGR